MTSGVWEARYPDLNGKVAVVAGTSGALGDIAQVLARSGVLAALVVDDRELVGTATGYADGLGVASFGVVADPTQRSTWERVASHIEQRLGPIDVVVAAGPPAARLTIADALIPDMAARGRGVVIEIGAAAEPLVVPAGLRHRAIAAAADVRALDLAAVVALCASDLLSAAEVGITLADP
ncbi:MAG TPA: hypothetical protein VHA79_12660 [Mycobacteriales bacterium]|nr:hypothetical protein [Mycobacteriales bacterium]